VTPYESVRVGFVAMALEKSRQAYSAGQSVESGLSSPIALLETLRIARVLFDEYRGMVHLA